jgi:tetraacyldisaccharide 4'-kinase
VGVDSREFVERVWYSRNAAASTLRTALVPAERLFGAIVGARDILYDAGWLPAAETAIPAVSIGNLTVGGTGKTPMAAWMAAELAKRGAAPGVVLRGYGADEPLVHELLNPGVPVIVNPDRAAGIAAAARAGAGIAVLDDAFQHRRVQRIADLVLVSADRWSGEVRLLPAGPWREPLAAVRRATLVVVTRKAATDEMVASLHAALASAAHAVPRVSVRLALGDLVRTGATAPRDVQPLGAVDGRAVHAVLSIADPQAFVRQLEERGATVSARIFPDHHAFTAAETESLATGFRPDDLIVCTLKDAVKLAPHWPRVAPPLWYVSQQVMVERGVGGLERVVDDLARLSSRTSPTAG